MTSLLFDLVMLAIICFGGLACWEAVKYTDERSKLRKQTGNYYDQELKDLQ